MEEKKRLLKISFKFPKAEPISSECVLKVRAGMITIQIDGEDRFEFDGKSLVDMTDYFFERRAELEEGRRKVAAELKRKRRRIG